MAVRWRSALLPLRRAVQVGVAGALVVLAGLHVYAAQLAQESFRKGEASSFWTWFHGLQGRDDHLPQSLSLPASGHWWAFEGFGVTWLDPLAALESALAGSVAWPLLAGVALPVVLTVLLGRVYCGWLCPMNLVLELNDRLRAVLTRHVLRPFAVPSRPWWRYAVLLAGGVAASVSGVGVLGMIYPPAQLSRLLEGLGAHGIGFGGGLLVGIVVLELLATRRMWCQHLCPGGALYSGLSWGRLLHVRRDRSRCTGCRTCVEVCGFGQAPMLDQVDQDCTSCGECVAKCPDEALSYRVELSGPVARLKAVVTTLAMLLAVVGGLCVGAGEADAHHILGRPHYSYSEAYPQLSSYELMAHGEGHRVVFTSFPGFVEPGQSARMVVYITDDAGEPYTGELRMGLTRKPRFGARETLVPLRTPLMDGHRGQLVHTFEADGEVLVDVVFYPNGKEEVLAFPLPVGASADGGMAWPVSAGLGLLLLLVVVAVVRKRRMGKPAAARAVTGVAAMLLVIGAMQGCADEAAERPASSASSSPSSRPGSEPGSEPGSMASSGPASEPGSMASSQPGSEPGSMPSGGHIMPGVPRHLTYGGIAALMFLTFVGFEVMGRRRRWMGGLERLERGRLNVLAWRPVRAVLGSRLGVFALRAPIVLLFLLVIAAGLFGVQHASANIAPVLTWTTWWILLVMFVLAFGKVWCTVCPWDALADVVRRVLPWRHGAEFTVGLSWPAWLRNIYPALILFVLLTWFELGWEVTKSPAWTAYLAIAMVVMAVVVAVVFDKKAFCRYGCLVGRISGLYSLFSPLELRALDTSVCAGCTSRACLKGSATTYPCPTGQKLWSMQRNTYCTLCMECTASCPHDNIGLNLRPLASDLLVPGDRKEGARADEALMALTMLALSSFHGLTMTPAWWEITEWIEVGLGVGYVTSFSLGMAGALLAIVALYGVFIGLTRLAAGPSRSGKGRWQELFVQLSYPLIPIALFYHLAHNAMHFFMEGQHILPLLSDPFGWGWDLFGTRGMQPGPLLELDTIWGLQVALILVGHLFSLFITHRIAPRVLEGRRVVWGQVPMLVLVVLYSLVSVWLVAQPMEMRTAM